MKQDKHTTHLLLSDKLEALSDSIKPKKRHPNFRMHRALFTLSTVIFRFGTGSLLLWLSITVFGPLYATTLEKYGSTCTVLGMSLLIMLPIVISIGVSMIPYYVVLPDAHDREKAQKKAMQNISLTKRMLPRVLLHLPCIAGTFLFSALYFTENFSAIPDMSRWVLWRPPLLLGVELSFYFLHRLAHTGHTSKNPIVRAMAKIHQRHHYENNGDGLVPMSLLYDDLGERFFIISLLLTAIVPFGGGHPLIIFPLMTYYYSCDGVWAHNKMVPITISKAHADHHLLRKGNYGLTFLADNIFGTMLDVYEY